jgi:hypothetical protein
VIRKRSGGVALSLGAILAVVASSAVIGPATASAATVTCRGTTATDDSLGQENGVDYSFHCNEDLIGYSIVTSKKLSYFNPAPTVYTAGTQDPSPTDSFSCEGGFPSNGFGCNGKATATNVIASDFATQGSTCGNKPSQRLKTWVVAVVVEIVDNGTTQTPTTKSSEPFQLFGPKCKYPKPGRHHHHGRHHHGGHHH